MVYPPTPVQILAVLRQTLGSTRGWGLFPPYYNGDAVTSEVIKPKPGIWKGVEYRSQLEIAWAQHLEANLKDGWQVCYEDSHEYDFSVFGDEGDVSRLVFIEVKPPVRRLCRQAIETVVNRRCTLEVCDHWLLVIGPPPSEYGHTGVVYLKRCYFGRLGAIAANAGLKATETPSHNVYVPLMGYLVERLEHWDHSAGGTADLILNHLERRGDMTLK